MTQSLGGLVVSTVQADDERLGGLVVSVIMEYVEGLFGVGGGVEAPAATIDGVVTFADLGPQPGPPSTPCRDDRQLGWSLVTEGTQAGRLAWRTHHAPSDALAVLGTVAAGIEADAAVIEVAAPDVPLDVVGALATLTASYAGRDVVVLRGVVISAEVGERGEASSISIGYDDGTPALWSPSQAVVEGSHPGPLPMSPARYRPVGSEGARYPIVYGYPGEIQAKGVAAGARPVVPLYLSEMASVVGPSFAGPLLDGRFLLDAQAVVWGQLSRSNTYWADTTGSGDVVELVSNAAGDPYWRVRGESGLSVTYPVLVAVGEDYEADTLGVGYQSTAGYGGGVVEDGLVITSLVGAASHLLRAAGLPFDARRSATAAAAWRGMRVDTWVDTDVDAREVVRSWVSLVGGELLRGPDGYWLRYVAPPSRAGYARWRIVEGVTGERLTRWSPSQGAPLGSLVIEYAPAFGEHLERLRLTPDGDGGLTLGHAGLSRAANAEARTVQCAWTFDQSTVCAVAEHIIADSKPTLTAQFAIPGADPLAWRVGDAVEVDGTIGVVIGVDAAAIGVVATIRLEA